MNGNEIKWTKAKFLGFLLSVNFLKLNNLVLC